MPNGIRVSARLALATAALALLAPGANEPASAANHREAPITSIDRLADITDFFAFVSYDDAEKVTFILCVDPLLEPGNGPNYFPFDPDITYAIQVDNDHDALEDLTFEFRFQTELRLPGVFTGFVGAGDGLVAPPNSPAPVPPGTPIVPPAIEALDGPGSEGLGLRQTYQVVLQRGRYAGSGSRNELSRGQTLYAVPTNVGPRTMPDYAALADQGIYDLGDGVRVFAGTVEDPFWIDLGAAFDSLNFRPSAFPSGVPGVLTDTQDLEDGVNFASDTVSGYNVNAIAIEVPIDLITRGRDVYPASDPRATIGALGVTLRPQTTVRRSPKPPQSQGVLRQVQRMGNPLINELLVGTGAKDRFSMDRPKNDEQFAGFFLDPTLARVLNAIYGIPIPTPPRLDLLPLVTYRPPVASPNTPSGPIADLLRLNTGVAATAESSRRRLGLLAGDPAGFPNGRRLSDDVTDIAARVVAGVLAGPPFNGFPHNRIGDAVNTNDAVYRETFPYLALAHSGRDRRHVDPGEPGGGPVN